MFGNSESKLVVKGNNLRTYLPQKANHTLLGEMRHMIATPIAGVDCRLIAIAISRTQTPKRLELKKPRVVRALPTLLSLPHSSAHSNGSLVMPQAPLYESRVRHDWAGRRTCSAFAPSLPCISAGKRASAVLDSAGVQRDCVH